MSTSDGSSRLCSMPAKHADGLGITRKSLEQCFAYTEVLNEYGAPVDSKYINHILHKVLRSQESGLDKLTKTELIRICTLEQFYSPRFEAVEAWRKEQGLKPSVPLDVELKSDDLENKNVQDNEYIRASLAERFSVFDGLEQLYAPCFEAVEAWRKEQGLGPSVLLDLEVKSDDLENKNLEDEYIRASLAERSRAFDGLEDHSPPFVTEGNVAVPILDGGELRSGLEYH